MHFAAEVCRYVHEHLANLEAGPSSLPRWWQLLRLVDHNDEPLGLRAGRKELTTQANNTAQYMQQQQQQRQLSGSGGVANGSRSDEHKQQQQQQEICTGDLAVPERAGGISASDALAAENNEGEVRMPTEQTHTKGYLGSLREPLLHQHSTGRRQQQQQAGKSNSTGDLQPEHYEVVIDRPLSGMCCREYILKQDSGLQNTPDPYSATKGI